MLKKVLRSKPVLRAVGATLAGYLAFVRRTNRVVHEPADLYDTLDHHTPAIIAMWHGQHFMVPFLRRHTDRATVMISRHGDGEINAVAVERLGSATVRGSGAQRQQQIRKRGGAQAMLAAIEVLADGSNLVMTADVPKVSRVAGMGIIKIAQFSGRAIIPVAAITSRRIDLKNWDCSSVPLPFGRLVLAVGTPILVPRNADATALEDARVQLEKALDDIHARAFARAGATDPGALRQSVADARALAAGRAA